MFDLIALPLEPRWPCTRRCIKSLLVFYGFTGRNKNNQSCFNNGTFT